MESRTLSRVCLRDSSSFTRAEAEPSTAKPGMPYPISDLELASRLSFFLWSTGPDAELVTLAGQGRLRQPAVLTAQVRRMLKDPRSEALAVNFAGQWLNLRGLAATSPLPLIYPDFDDPLRQAMRREVELIFDSIVREDRNIVNLLDADYTFVNERLAKHYGIRGIYGSQFRRVTLDRRSTSARACSAKEPFWHDRQTRAEFSGDPRQEGDGEPSRCASSGSAARRSVASCASK